MHKDRAYLRNRKRPLLMHQLDLLKKSCYKSSAAARPSDGVQEDDGRHNKVAVVRVLRRASAALGLIVRTAHTKITFL